MLTIYCTTAAIKYADGTLSQLARVPASDELQTLRQRMGKGPNSPFFTVRSVGVEEVSSHRLTYLLLSRNDAPVSGHVDGDPLTPEVGILYKPLKKPIEQSSI